MASTVPNIINPPQFSQPGVPVALADVPRYSSTQTYNYGDVVTFNGQYYMNFYNSSQLCPPPTGVYVITLDSLKTGAFGGTYGSTNVPLGYWCLIGSSLILPTAYNTLNVAEYTVGTAVYYPDNYPGQTFQCVKSPADVIGKLIVEATARGFDLLKVSDYVLYEKYPDLFWRFLGLFPIPLQIIYDAAGAMVPIEQCWNALTTVNPYSFSPVAGDSYVNSFSGLINSLRASISRAVESNTILITGITFTPQPLLLTTGFTTNYTSPTNIAISPIYASNQRLSITSTNNNIVSVSSTYDPTSGNSFIARGVASGSASIILASTDGSDITTIVPVIVQDIVLTAPPQPISVAVASTVQLVAQSSGALIYTSGSTAIATVSVGGLVTGVASGNTTITISSGSLTPLVVPITVL